MVYTAKVKFFDSFDGDKRTHRLFVSGNDYEEVLRKITHYYSQNMVESLTITQFASGDLIVFDQDDERLFKEMRASMKEKIPW